MTRAFAFALTVLLMPPGAGAQAVSEQNTVAMSVVTLRGLDTMSGIARDVLLRVGEKRQFGHLEIIADTCRVPRGDEKADAFVFLRVRDIRETAPRFSGWMFASSPALSALDHPRYDIWVASCSNS